MQKRKARTLQVQSVLSHGRKELAFIKNKIVERAYVIEQNLEQTGGLQDGRYSLLDIGCGEGFLLQYFHEKGDMEHILPEMAERGETFTVINMDRVLDMVLNPGLCLEQVKALMTNYYEKPEVGKAAHQMTVRMENLLYDTSLERTVEIYRMLGDMGFGREIIGVFRIKQ